MPEDDPRTDPELVEAANDGDVSAFSALYRRHRDWVVRLAWRFTGDHHDALEVLQETFRYLLRKLPDLHLSARMTTFLYPVVRNLSIRIAKRRRRTLQPDEGLFEDMPAPDPPAEREELAAALAALDPDRREVVLMRYVDEMSLREIAGALDLPVGTVKSRLHYALQALREDERTRTYFLK